MSIGPRRIAEEPFELGLDVGGRQVLVRVWILRRQPRGHAVELRVRLVERHSRWQAGNGIQQARTALLGDGLPGSPTRRRARAWSRSGSAAAPMGYVKPAGATPTTVFGSPSIVIERPTIAGSPPNCVCQTSWLRTTTRASGRFLVREEPAPECRRHAQKVEEIPRHHHRRRGGRAGRRRSASRRNRGSRRSARTTAARRSSKNVK